MRVHFFTTWCEALSPSVRALHTRILNYIFHKHMHTLDHANIRSCTNADPRSNKRTHEQSAHTHASQCMHKVAMILTYSIWRTCGSNIMCGACLQQHGVTRRHFVQRASQARSMLHVPPFILLRPSAAPLAFVMPLPSRCVTLSSHLCAF